MQLCTKCSFIAFSSIIAARIHAYISVYACARSMNQKSGIIASSETGKFIDRLRKIYRNCSFYNFRKRKCGEEKEFSRYRSNYELNVIKITRVIAG